MIYFITVNYYSAKLIANLLKSIETLPSKISYKFIIINNSPDDLSIYALNRDCTQILEPGKNLGFGAGCNLGISWVFRQYPQAIIWIINPDTLLLKDSLEKIPQFFEAHPEVSILGTIVYEGTGKVWFAGGEFIPQTGGIIERNLFVNNSEVPYVACEWVTGCSFLINLKNFQECPLFDTHYFLYYEDFDFCKRYASQGHLIGVTNQFGVIHHPSSIADRDYYTKYKYSTYSYFLTMEKYADKRVLWARSIRLVLHAIVLLGWKPRVAIGKLEGAWIYLTRSRLL